MANTTDSYPFPPNTPQTAARPYLNINEFNTRIVDPAAINFNFCQELSGQITATRLKSGEERVFQRVDEQIDRINMILNGAAPPPTTTTDDIFGTRNTKNGSDDDEVEAPDGLLTPSKWVYETPDKQKYRKMDEITVNYSNEGMQLEPAVLEDKTLYGFKAAAMQRIDNFFSTETLSLDINLRYLEPICNLADEPEGNNQFLNDATEKTLNIDKQLNWYEQHIQRITTARPSKQVDNRKYKATIQGKCLSFEEESSGGSRSRIKRFKSDSDQAFNNEEESSALFEPDLYPDECK